MEKSRNRHTVSVNEENKVRVKKLLTEAVTLLCKNSISYGAELSIEGLLGITVDSTEVYLVNFNEKVMNDVTTDPGNGIVENSDAGYIQRLRDRLHNTYTTGDSPTPSDDLSHRLPGVSAPKYRHQEKTTPAAIVNDENDTVIDIKTERLDEDGDVTSVWTRSGAASISMDISDMTYNLPSTVSTSCVFENDTDIPNIDTFSSVNTFPLKSISDTSMPVSCSENIEDAAPAILPNAKKILGVALDRKAKLADASCNAHHAQTQSNVSLPKSNLLKPERPLMTAANEFQLHDGTGDTCAPQGNNGADFVVLDADSAPFIYGTANNSPVHTLITSGDDSQHNQPSWRTSEMTGPGDGEKKPMLPSTSHENVHNRIAAYTYSPMTCKVCGRVLRNRTIYTRHIKTHMACMFSCHVCNREFNRKDSLKRHYLLHKYDIQWPSSELEQCAM